MEGASLQPILSSNQVYLNFSLTNSTGIIVNDKSLSIAFDGTFLDKNKEGQMYPLP